MKPPRWILEFAAWIAGTVAGAALLSLALHLLGVTA